MYFLLWIELISVIIVYLTIIYIETSDENLIPRNEHILTHLILEIGHCGKDTVESIRTRVSLRLFAIPCASVFYDSVDVARANSETLL